MADPEVTRGKVVRWLLGQGVAQALEGTGLPALWLWIKRLSLALLTFAGGWWLFEALETQGVALLAHPGVMAAGLAAGLVGFFILLGLLRFALRVVRYSWWALAWLLRGVRSPDP
ncbi:MAG: hypothetical protein ACFCBW_22805 [Candidatus Competibacterales bacterium]